MGKSTALHTISTIRLHEHSFIWRAANLNLACHSTQQHDPAELLWCGADMNLAFHASQHDCAYFSPARLSILP
jgi:hypothetical protein